MAVLQATNNGGFYNTVHNQTDDGSVFSVVDGDEYVPITFSYCDYLGTRQTHLIASGEIFHDHLMRGDCGVRRKDDSMDLLFSWDKTTHEIEGFTEAPDGVLHPATREHNEHVECTRICGLEGHKTEFYRKDREYWTPGTTLKATSVPEIFGWTQYNPLSCPPDPKNKCGEYILKGDKKKC